MNLREDLLRGIYAYGFEKPSAIQQRAIIPCIRGKIFKICLKHVFFSFKYEYYGTNILNTVLIVNYYKF